MTPGAVYHGPLAPYGRAPSVLCSTVVALLPDGELYEGRVQCVPVPTVGKWGSDFDVGWLARVDDGDPETDDGEHWRYVHDGELDETGPGWKPKIFESSGDAFDAARTLFGTFVFAAGRPRGERGMTVSPRSCYVTGRDGLSPAVPVHDERAPVAVGPITPGDLQDPDRTGRGTAYLLLTARPKDGAWLVGLGIYSEERPTQVGSLCVGTVGIFNAPSYELARAAAETWANGNEFVTGGLAPALAPARNAPVRAEHDDECAFGQAIGVAGAIWAARFERHELVDVLEALDASARDGNARLDAVREHIRLAVAEPKTLPVPARFDRRELDVINKALVGYLDADFDEQWTDRLAAREAARAHVRRLLGLPDEPPPAPEPVPEGSYGEPMILEALKPVRELRTIEAARTGPDDPPIVARGPCEECGKIGAGFETTSGRKLCFGCAGETSDVPF